MSTRYDSNYSLEPVAQQPLHEAKPLQHVETVKDILTFELRRFFEARKDGFKFLGEIPNIEKYRLALNGEESDQFVSAVQVMRQLPDINQKLPLLAITAATGRTKKLGIGSQYVGVVQDPPRLTTTRGPWNVSAGAQLLFKTSKGQTLITFSAGYAVDLASLKPLELQAIINTQSNRLQAFVMPDNTVSIRLKDSEFEFIQVLPVELFDYTGAYEGPSANPSGLITCDGWLPSGIPRNGANSDASAVFGLVGLSDNIYNSARPPKHRYQTAKDLSLNIDIGAEDDNQRTELTDLLSYFFEIFMQQTDFVVLGDAEKGQNWQIALKCEMSLSGESEIPRPEGDGFAKIYVNRVSIPLISIDYVDRPAVRPSQVSHQALVLGGDQ